VVDDELSVIDEEDEDEEEDEERAAAPSDSRHSSFFCSLVLSAVLAVADIFSWLSFFDLCFPILPLGCFGAGVTVAATPSVILLDAETDSLKLTKST